MDYITSHFCHKLVWWRFNHGKVIISTYYVRSLDVSGVIASVQRSLPGNDTGSNKKQQCKLSQATIHDKGFGHEHRQDNYVLIFDFFRSGQVITKVQNNIPVSFKSNTGSITHGFRNNLIFLLSVIVY